MSTAKTKRKMKRQNARRDVTSSGATPKRRQSAADSAISGPVSSTESGSSATSRPSPPSALTRSQGQRNLAPGRPEARRARANATADMNPYSPPQVSKPAALTRQNARRDLNATGKTAREFSTGRTLFQVKRETPDGKTKTQYLPSYKDATKRERNLGRYVDDASVTKAPVNKLPTTGKIKSVHEVSTGRTLYATESANGKIEYLPKKDEATGAELSQGKYLPEKDPVNQPLMGETKSVQKEPDTKRTLFATQATDGSTEYLPTKSEATPVELSQGKYVPDTMAEQDPVNTLLDPATVKRASVKEWSTGRTLFATQRPDGKIEYLPMKKDASAAEKRQGKYAPDAAIQVDPIDSPVLNKRPVYQFSEQRNLFVTRRTDGKIEYLPKESNATPYELSQGRYVSDDAISDNAPVGPANAMSNRPPRYDIDKGRTEYAVATADGIDYLPRESDASGQERADGLFIPDDIVDRHEDTRRRTALQDDSAEQRRRRAQRAEKLAGGATRQDRDAAPRPMKTATDGTALWDGMSPPLVSGAKQNETLSKLRPIYDRGNRRMLYATETAKGQIDYLPLKEAASSYERASGLYVTFVPPEPLENFLANAAAANTISRQTFETEAGEVSAYAEEDIKKAIEQAPTLVLRSAKFVSDSARQTPALQQKFREV